MKAATWRMALVCLPSGMCLRIVDLTGNHSSNTFPMRTRKNVRDENSAAELSNWRFQSAKRIRAKMVLFGDDDVRKSNGKLLPWFAADFVQKPPAIRSVVSPGFTGGSINLCAVSVG
jgi:hypothetical protein